MTRFVGGGVTKGEFWTSVFSIAVLGVAGYCIYQLVTWMIDDIGWIYVSIIGGLAVVSIGTSIAIGTMYSDYDRGRHWKRMDSRDLSEKKEEVANLNKIIADKDRVIKDKDKIIKDLKSSETQFRSLEKNADDEISRLSKSIKKNRAEYLDSATAQEHISALGKKLNSESMISDDYYVAAMTKLLDFMPHLVGRIRSLTYASPDMKRIDRYDEVLSKYNEKIKKYRESDMGDDEKEDAIDAMKNLRNQEIANLTELGQ